LNHQLVAAIQAARSAERRRTVSRARTSAASRAEAVGQESYLPGIAAL
jgi:hypothetical protein